MPYEPRSCPLCLAEVHVDGDVMTEQHEETCPNWTSIPYSWNQSNMLKAHRSMIDHWYAPSCASDLSTYDEWTPYVEGGGTHRAKETPIDGYEFDWISTRWRRMLASFGKAGRGKAIKTAMNRRARRRSNMERYDDCQDDS